MLMRDVLLRVSEVANLTWDDLTIQADGSSRLNIRRSKTDREGEGAIQFISPTTTKALMRICLQGEKKSERIFPFTVQHIRRRIKAAYQTPDQGRISDAGSRPHASPQVWETVSVDTAVAWVWPRTW